MLEPQDYAARVTVFGALDSNNPLAMNGICSRDDGNIGSVVYDVA